MNDWRIVMGFSGAKLPSPEEIRRNEERGFWRKAGPVADLARIARTDPSREAVVDSRGRLGYGELARLVQRIAAGLHALGVRSGTCVAVQLPNWVECMATHLALEGLGATSLPLPPIYRLKELRYILQRTQAAVALIAHEFRGFDHRGMFEELGRACPRLARVVVVGAVPRALPAGWLGFEEFLALGDGGGPTLDELAAADPNRITEIAFTSGSTGDPKGVMHTSNTLTTEDMAHAHAFGLDGDDVFFMPSTLGHQLGFSVGLRLPILLGAKVVYQDLWEPRKAIELIARERCTFTVTTPTFLLDVLRALPPGSARNMLSMTTWGIAGAVATSALHGEARASMPHLRLVHCFGITEVGAMILAPQDRPPEKHLASGYPQPGLELKVVDPEGAEVAPDVEGELVVRSPSMFVGYHEQPDLMASAFTDEGYFRTGDQVRRDADGWVYVTGRVKDLIKRGGENISPAEIEEVLAAHPRVAEVAVVGMPDERLGERVCAFVVTRGGAALSMADVVECVQRAGLAKQKWPEHLKVVDALPRSSIGKIRKATLRESLVAEAAAKAST